ncbi:MAG: hypothetical protein K0U54_01030 [Bacteroidetes bacterium]|nr:hypothetical protein [Bacteroidota bacterium]
MAFKAKTGKDKHTSHTTQDAIKELTKEELKGFHIQLPVKLHTDFKSKVASNGEKMKDVIIKMVQEYVGK